MQHKYTGTYIRKTGHRVVLRDNRVPIGLSEYSITCGTKGKKKVYIVCDKLLAGNVHCDFSIRKDVFVENPEKFGKHKCCSSHIDNYFRPEEEAITIDQVTGSLIEFVGSSKLSMNIISSEFFQELFTFTY